MSVLKIIRWYKPEFGWINLPKPISVSELTISCLQKLGYTHLVLHRNDEEHPTTPDEVMETLKEKGPR